MHLPLELLLLTSTALALPSLLTRQTTPQACNNHASLCSKSYSDITHLGAHDSPFLRNGTSNSGFGLSSAGNQNVDSVAQLSAGVRLLSAQVHRSNNALHLCHSSCSLLDAGLLRDWLGTIKGWMDTNPNEVVTILLVNSDGAAATELDAEFTGSGISTYGYVPTTAGQWPTLQEMIGANKRLVTFIADLPQSSGYLLNEFDHIFENSYNNTTPQSFTCTPDRPDALRNQPASAALSTGRLPLVNHFLYSTMTLGSNSVQTPDTDSIDTTNAASGTGSLGEAGDKCKNEYGGRAPWGFLVDYIDKGETLKVVDGLNGVETEEAQGRREVMASFQGKGKAVTVPKASVAAAAIATAVAGLFAI